jgi:uncharacterized protein YdcH (DUF465 family)
MAADAQDLQDFKATLLQTNGEFRQMVTEHQTLDERINQLARLAYLTDQQQFEEISLKKRKLALKDRIEAVLRGHRTGVPISMPSH